jgi:hypothetical protein
MRRPLALAALLVLTWSNVTALQCGAAALSPMPSDAAAGQRPHGSHGSAPSHAGAAEAQGHEHHGSTSHPASPDCVMMMACGVAIGASGIAPGDVDAEVRERASPPILVAPSTTDLSRDTPPPRPYA